jgi:hypothetical protein
MSGGWARGLVNGGVGAWRILPLHTPGADGRCSCGRDCGKDCGKHPRTPHGLLDATTDEATVRAWWERWPDANVAILTGAANDLWVLDADGAGGLEALAALERQHGQLPLLTPRVRTGGGGLHYYFKWPTDGTVIRNRTRLHGLPIDVRGEGGYAVAPPSRHRSGSVYAWELAPGEGIPAEAPAWLLALVRGHADGRNGKAAAPAEGEPIPEGRRNSTLTRLAGSMRAAGLGADEILAALLVVNRERCQPPLPDKEVETIARSVSRYDPGDLDPPTIVFPSTPSAEEDWPLPIPFDETPDVPSFPTDLLPRWLRDWALALAETLQVPVDLPAMLGLGAAAGGLAKKFRVEVRPGWTEPLNLYVAVALEVGERKTAAFVEALKPVVAFEAAEQARTVALIATRTVERRQLELAMRREEAVMRQQNASNEDREAARRRSVELAAQLAGITIPEPPRLLCEDATPESLVPLLAAQGGRVLVASDEGSVFEICKGRYGEKPNFEVWLKGHSGGFLRVDRVGRDPLSVDDPAISAAMAVQPDVILGLGDLEVLWRRGFPQRWLYAVPRSQVGSRKVATDPVPAKVAEAYTSTMTRLWSLSAGGNLAFSPEAEQAMQGLSGWIEPQLVSGGELHRLRGWLGKLAGAAARLAAILHTSAALTGGASEMGTVSEETAAAAMTLAREYLLPHAQAAFSLMGASKLISDARLVLRWLRARFGSSEVFERDGNTIKLNKRLLHQGVKSHFQSVADLDPVLVLLEKHRFLRSIPRAARPGRPSPEFWVNPRLQVPDTSQNTQNP